MKRAGARARAPARLDRGGGDNRRPGGSRRSRSCSAAPSRSARRRHSRLGRPGREGHFDYVNAQGGVNGRKIEYRYYDDGYDLKVQTVQPG